MPTDRSRLNPDDMNALIVRVVQDAGFARHVRAQLRAPDAADLALLSPQKAGRDSLVDSDAA